MAKDPAFLFYPGDYLRDTQMLSEKTQVAYDRIMCEHMRNICISQKQLKFLTKKLSEDEIDELMMILEKVPGGFQITWVAESIIKRREYSESRRKNRTKTKKKTTKKISSSYDKHMENENENENVIVIKDESKNEKKSDLIFPFDSENFKKQWQVWRDYKKEQFKFIYKPIGEQAALKEIGRLSKNNEQTAIAIIQQSINNGWKGFFELKNNNNGNKQGLSSSEIAMDYAKRKAAERNAKRNATSYE